MARVGGTARVNGRGYLVLLGVLGAQRLLEVGVSARNLRRSTPGTIASARTFPLMVAANTALFAVPAVTRFGKSKPPRVVQKLAAGGLVAAIALRVWVIAILGREWNVQAKVPETMTPVLHGPYKWIRHPNYVAVALEFATVPLLAGGYLESVLLSGANAAVLLPRIRDEEKLLEPIPAYRVAFASTPRFVPLALQPHQRKPVTH